MVVVAHQAVGVGHPVEVLDHRAENVEEGGAIFVVLVDRLATVTAGGDVVERSGKLQSRRSSHWAIAAELCYETRPDPKARTRVGSQARCSGCAKPAPGYDQLPQRRFEFIPLWGFTVELLYRMRRVQ